MKKTIALFTSLIVMVLMSITLNAQVLLNEQFNYSIGDTVTSHGWNEHGNLGVNKILVTNGNLYYSHYFTPIGQSALLSSAGGQDINHTFTTQTSGSVYAAMLINVSSVSSSTTGDHFFHFLKGTTTFTGRVYIKRDATDTTLFKLGILKGSNTANIVFSPALLSVNTTHLIVLKYTIITGTTNDSVSLFINPVTTSEGSPSVTASDITSPDIDPAAIALRQPSASSAPNITIDGLRVATTWADAIGYSGIATSAVVITGATNGITSFTANCAGNVLYDGDSAVIERGICYGTSINPDTTGAKVLVAGNTGVFIANLTSLNSSTLYHYRAFAKNSAGISYGADSAFTTLALVPIVTTAGISAIATTTATIAAEVVNDGGATISEKGICYGTSISPTITGTKIIVTPAVIGLFSGNLTGLTSSTLYHVRAYATNTIGTGYGADSTFTTAINFVAPIVNTGGASSITITTATCAGNVTSDGGTTITNRGICYGNTINPDTTGTKVIATAATGAFTGNLTGLTAYSLYHYRAYATNSIGISFGGDSTFTTAMDTIYCATIADLRTKIANNSTIYKLSNQVVLTCKLTNRSQKYIQDTSAAIIIDDPNPAKITTVYNIGDGITGIKGKLENYFGLLEFHPIADPGAATSTANVVNPLIVTAANIQDTAFMKNHQSKLIKLNNVSFTDANGTLAFANGKKYRLTQNTTIDSLFYTYIYNINYITKILPSGSGNITGVVNLSLNKYYITARDSSDMAFLNAVIPTVITGSTTLITATTATCAGNVTSDGGATVSLRCICYDLTQNPTTGNYTSCTSGGTGSFSANLISLTPGTTYHYRAYATNLIGTAYGADSSFTTAILVVAPTVITGASSAITTNAATCAGNVTSDGGATLTERGICWNTTVNPITTNSKVTVSGNTGSFTGNLTSLTASTLYHYRAYAINSIGTSYGADSSFTTTTVGIKENEANKIGIYPNPSNGKFTVNVEKFNNGEIRIYTMVGSLILSQEINKANNEFDLSGHGKGIYFIQYTNPKSGKSWTEKLIIK
ncbi:MAG: T9SS type A sorting domain-containing protein [Bacteroidetes bacterium]|nr:T9SS type A sorting domain-containing protein [Bacteroidota bacterium]